jgi:hypothetical protein
MCSYRPTDLEIANALADSDATADDISWAIKNNWPGTYTDDLAAVLRTCPWPGMVRLHAIDRVHARRKARGCNTPLKFEQTVQSAFNTANDQSTSRDQHHCAWLFTSHVINGQTYWAMHASKPNAVKGAAGGKFNA